MEQVNDVMDNGVSFDSADLLFDDNQRYFSEIDEFPGFKSTILNPDFNNQTLTMEDLQIPFETNDWGYNQFHNPGQWDQNYPDGSYGNFQNQQFNGEVPTNQINSFQDSQEYKDFSTNQITPFQHADCYTNDQYLQIPQNFNNKQTNYIPSPNSDYFSGNNSSDSSPPHSSTNFTQTSDYSSAESSKQTSKQTNKQTLPLKHNLGNLPNGLMKALTTVLTQTNNPAFKQLIKTQETTPPPLPKGKVNKIRKQTTKIASKIPETKKAPLIIPIQKTGLGNKASLEEMRKKKAERMIRNREAALQSRKRKLEEQAALEDTCKDLQDRNVQLEKQVSFLEGRLSQIEETNRKLETQLAKFSKPSKILASVCFLMFVSFIAFSSSPISPGLIALPPSHPVNIHNDNYIPETVNELQWLLRPANQLWKNINSLFYAEEKYELAVTLKTQPIPAINNNNNNNNKKKPDPIDTNTPSISQKFASENRFHSRVISDRTMDYSLPQDLIISLPEQEWPPGLNSTHIHSDFLHFLKNQSVTKELTVSQNSYGGKNRPMMLRYPPSDNPLYLKYLNETSFIFDSLQPEFHQKPQNLFVVSLDHAFWVPSRSTPDQTLSLIFPSHKDFVSPNYFSWTRWDCVVTGYQEFLTPIPA